MCNAIVKSRLKFIKLKANVELIESTQWSTWTPLHLSPLPHIYLAHSVSDIDGFRYSVLSEQLGLKLTNDVANMCGCFSVESPLEVALSVLPKLEFLIEDNSAIKKARWAKEKKSVWTSPYHEAGPISDLPKLRWAIGYWTFFLNHLSYHVRLSLKKLYY